MLETPGGFLKAEGLGDVMSSEMLKQLLSYLTLVNRGGVALKYRQPTLSARLKNSQSFPVPDYPSFLSIALPCYELSR